MWLRTMTTLVIDPQTNLFLIDSRSATTFLDVVLASFFLTPWNHDDVLSIKSRNDVVPVREGLDTGVVGFLRACEQIALDLFKKLRNALGEVSQWQRSLDTIVSTDRKCLVLGKVGRSNLKPKGNTLYR